jgi:hypothetical protein
MSYEQVSLEREKRDAAKMSRARMGARIASKGRV